jgi:hypothetical protein
MPESLIPNRQHTLPTLNHVKEKVYIDYPLVGNATVTTEPFYVEYDFTICTSSLAATTLYKWNGGSWTEVSGITNPDVIFGRGYYAVTTSSNQYVSITEHVRTSEFVTAFATPR